MRQQGLQTHRFKDNPEERRFAKSWEAWNTPTGSAPPYILVNELLECGAGQVTRRDQAVAATVIQWLGSPVGLTFLEQLGYKKDVGPAKPAKAVSLSRVRCHALLQKVSKSLSELATELNKRT
jgi:hypothetical protein